VKEIVDNWIADYELNYLLYSERDNRRNFSGSASFVLSRYFLPIRQVFDEFVYRLVTDSFPPTDGPGGRQDYINGLVTGLEFLTDIVSTPEAGVYHFDEAQEKFVSGEPKEEGQKKLIVPEGMGKQLMGSFGSVNGVDVPVKRGALFDKLGAMMAMTLRGFPSQKYQRASLTVNYYDFEIFRTPLFDSFSKTMQGNLIRESKAVYVDALKAYVAITDESASQMADDMEVIDAKLDAASNNVVEDYSMIFAVSDLNNDADQTFRDYVDFRIVGVDDQGVPDGVETVKFLSASGTKEYLIPQTLDERSITYAIAKDAPLKSEQYHDIMDFLNDPETTGKAADLLEDATPAVLVAFKKVWERVEGSPMPDSVESAILGDKESGLTQMLDLTNRLSTNFATALEQAKNAGDEEAIKRFQELVDFMIIQKKVIDEVSLEYVEFNKKVEEGETKSLTLKNDLIQIESRLLKIKKYYDILN
jgi:hypothetical protein